MEFMEAEIQWISMDDYPPAATCTKWKEHDCSQGDPAYNTDACEGNTSCCFGAALCGVAHLADPEKYEQEMLGEGEHRTAEE